MSPIASIRDTPPELSVVLPAYNEGRHLRANLHCLAQHLSASDWSSFDLIVVDDGSQDGTAEEARRAVQDGLPVRIVCQPINRGKGAALLVGAGQARGNYVAFLDADLEIGPESLLRSLAMMRARGHAVVVGVRTGESLGEGRAFPLPRRLMSRFYRLLVHALFDLPSDTQTGLKLFRRPVLIACLPRLRAERFAFDVEILTACQRLGYPIATCPVAVDYRREGRLGRMTARQVLGMLGETLAIYYRASFWCWLKPGRITQLWILALGTGLLLFGVGLGKLLTPLVLAAPVKAFFYVVALQFLPRLLRDWLLVLAGALICVLALVVLNKRILAAFARRDAGDMAGIWRWTPSAPDSAVETWETGDDRVAEPSRVHIEATDDLAPDR